MAQSRSIIVGGGIAAGVPFTLGSLPRIVDVDPPTIANSIAFQRTQGGLEVITVGLQLGTDWPLPATFTERLQVVGGLISDTGATAGVAHDNVVMGRGASAFLQAQNRSVSIGTGADWDAGSGCIENVLIGFQLSPITADVGSSVLVGSRITLGALFPVLTTIVGANNITNNAFSGPGVGIGSTWQGAGCGFGNQQSTSAVNNWSIVGRSAQANATGVTVHGDNARGDHANGITLGRNAISLVANGFLAGAQNVGITTVHFGEGDTVAAPATVTYRHTNASGADAQGANVVLRASLGTGAAVTQGQIQFATGAVIASSSTLQAATVRFAVLPSTGAAAAPILSFLGYTDGAAAGVATFTNAPLTRVAIAYIPVLTLAGQGWIPIV